MHRGHLYDDKDDLEREARNFTFKTYKYFLPKLIQNVKVAVVTWLGVSLKANSS